MSAYVPTGGAYVPRSVTVAYAATVTPDSSTTDVLNIGALTGNLTLDNPAGTPADGQNLRIRFSQDSTGGRTITFASEYAFGSDITTSLVPTTASANWEMLFTWNSANTSWRAVAIARGF